MKLPRQIEIIEVCPRDGFQNIDQFIETEDKIEIVKNLIDTGFRRIEITSFVSPKYVPQMRDAIEVCKAVRNYISGRGVNLIALIPNRRGFETAITSGVDEINYVVSVSEWHNMKNVGRTTEESMEDFKRIATDKGSKKLRISLATTFGCPFGDEIKSERLMELAISSLEYGADEILLADTFGLANPVLVERILSALLKKIDADKLCLHMHDTCGGGLANILTAMQYGIFKFESASGGLGGCPFAPGASGNIPTEDLLYMINGMGIKTGIDFNRLINVVFLISKRVNTPITSHLWAMSECLRH